MNKKLITLAIAGAVATPFAAQAGSITVPNMDIQMSGGITGAWIYQSDTKQDQYVVDDALLDFSSEAKAGGMGFDLGVGTLTGNALGISGRSSTGATIIGGGSTAVNSATGGGYPGDVGVQYGYVTVMPTDGLKIDAGLLPTNVGYEVYPSYANGNILRGAVWAAQPAYYTGARATYSMGGMSVYVEGSKQDVSNTANGQAIGGSFSMGAVNGSISYFNQEDVRSIVDLIFSTKAGNIDLAANIDYIAKADKMKKAAPTGTDDNAYGVALYASIPMGDKASLPMRLEYINDGTSNLYGLNPGGVTGTTVSKTAYTFTITPTYNFTDATFVRAELAYTSTDKKTVLADDKTASTGIFTDSNLTVGAQAGVRF